MDSLSQLKAIDFSHSTPETVREILSSTQIPIIEYTIFPGVYIIRGRKGLNFHKKEDMTYCPVQYCKNFQRATLPGQTMFYGVISDDQSHLENARAISAIECSALCKEGTQSFGRESFTISHWIVEKPLRVCSFVSDTTFANINNNILLNQIREAFIRHHNNSTEYIKRVARFISDEFAKTTNDPSEYLISATIATDCINDLGFDGVIYPSVKLGGQAGLNIALSPHAVDTKLRFERTLEQTIYKNGAKAFIRIERACEGGVSTIIRHATDDEVAKSICIDDINCLPIR